MFTGCIDITARDAMAPRLCFTYHLYTKDRTDPPLKKERDNLAVERLHILLFMSRCVDVINAHLNTKTCGNCVFV